MQFNGITLRPVCAEYDHERERGHCDFPLESSHEPPFIQNTVIRAVTPAMCAAMHHLMKMAANASDTDYDDIWVFKILTAFVKLGVFQLQQSAFQ